MSDNLILILLIVFSMFLTLLNANLMHIKHEETQEHVTNVCQSE